MTGDQLDAAPSAPRGRRPGNPDTRRRILEAAHAEFSQQPYEATSMRAIARRAGVDPALLRHYFADKTALFLQAAQIDFDPRVLVRRLAAGGRAGVGERAVATALRLWESPLGASLIAALRRDLGLLPSYGKLLGSAMSQATDLLLDELPAEERKVRTALVETIMSGLLMARYVARIEPVASLPGPTIVRRWGALVQRVLDSGVV